MHNSIGMPLLFSFVAGVSTLVGSILALFYKKFNQKDLSFALGLSAGAMVYLSFMELVPIALKSLSYEQVNIGFFAGMGVIALIDWLIPQHYNSCSTTVYSPLFKSGILLALAITIHNIPEGIAVFMGTVGDVKSGLLLSVATALHNIPEGIAVAAPIYYATKKKLSAFKYSFVAGMAEPVGAVAAYVLLLPYINQSLLAWIFAFVAGVMIYISLDELLPTCFQNTKGHIAISGVLTGMGLIAISLYWL